MIADVSIRLATLADASDIALMTRDHIENGLPWGWRPERVARAIRSSSCNVAVVGRPGAVIGFGIMSYADDEAHLLLFGVRPARQRRGIGSALLHWLEEVARTAGVRRIPGTASRRLLQLLDQGSQRDGADGLIEWKVQRTGMHDIEMIE